MHRGLLLVSKVGDKPKQAKNAQEAKEPRADVKASNGSRGEAGDGSAPGPSPKPNKGAKRPQSSRSSSVPKGTGAAKGGRVGKGAKAKVSGGPKQDLRMLVHSRLKDFLKDGKYNSIIRIIADPDFLAECYRSIKSNSGNMTKGSTNETFDGKTLAYF